VRCVESFVRSPRLASRARRTTRPRVAGARARIRDVDASTRDDDVATTTDRRRAVVRFIH